MCQKTYKHYGRKNPLEVYRLVKDINKVMLDGAMSWEHYNRAKMSVLANIAVSHKPVVANWFVV